MRQKNPGTSGIHCALQVVNGDPSEDEADRGCRTWVDVIGDQRTHTAMHGLSILSQAPQIRLV
jgi:hypothetical protein